MYRRSSKRVRPGRPPKKRSRRADMSPAEGERKAAGGLRFQYQVSAYLILRALKEPTLEWIRIADPAAGRVDDFQLGRPGQADGFQFKSAAYGGHFSFRDLVRPENGKPSLIAQLAHGWKTLQKLHPGRRIKVHLVTNQMPSVSDSLPTSGSKQNVTRHFAAFILECWKPSQRAPRRSKFVVPRKWTKAWSVLRRASQCSDEGEFLRFVGDCVLEFGVSMLNMFPDSSREAQVFEEDLRRVSDLLFSLVADRSKPVHLDRLRLLQELEWTERFEFRSRHEFPLDERLYQPIKTTRQSFTANFV